MGFSKGARGGAVRHTSRGHGVGWNQRPGGKGEGWPGSRSVYASNRPAVLRDSPTAPRPQSSLTARDTEPPIRSHHHHCYHHHCLHSVLMCTQPYPMQSLLKLIIILSIERKTNGLDNIWTKAEQRSPLLRLLVRATGLGEKNSPKWLFQEYYQGSTIKMDPCYRVTTKDLSTMKRKMHKKQRDAIQLLKSSV